MSSSTEDKIQIEIVEKLDSTESNTFTADNFREKVFEYVERAKPHIAILTPCYGGQCFVNYVSCLMNTANLLNSLNIPCRIEFCRNDSLVSRARNNLIAKAMNEPTITHCFFIDADITWEPSDVLKLLLADKGIVGGVYPIKSFDWTKLTAKSSTETKYDGPNNVIADWLRRKNDSQLKDLVTDEDFIQQKLVRYNINHNGPTMEIRQNLACVRHLATGFMMIKRGVIEKMSEAFPSTKYVDDVGFLKGEENKFAYALFDCGVEDGHYCSEDWLFCNRWSKMGGQVWIDVSINLTHTGNQDFKGSFVSSLV